MAVDNERKYLLKAIEKSGYVIVVLAGDGVHTEVKLDYISPNASKLGINVDLLYQGLKLPIDYVHPEDRSDVQQTCIRAIAEGLKDYVHLHRMVGDDGTVYNIRDEITVATDEDGVVRAEMYMKELSDDAKNLKGKVKRSGKKEEEIDMKNWSDIMDEKEKSRAMVELFANLTGLYSTVLDLEGKNMYPPVGPDTNLGDFYDLFQTPQYRDFFDEVKANMESELATPEVLDRPEGGIGKLSAVPIKVGRKLYAIWMIGSYTQEETDMLQQVYREQWNVGELVADFLKKSYSLEIEIAKARGAGKKLREELARQNISNEALTKINGQLMDNVESVLTETLRSVGMNLDVDRIFLYTKDRDRKKGYRLRANFSMTGMEPDTELLTILPEHMNNVIRMVESAGGYVVADRSTMTEEYKLTLMKYSFKGVIIHPIYMQDKIYGLLFFAESSAERVWTKEERRFTRSISIIVQNMLESADGEGNLRRVNRDLLDTYNCLHIGVFVRDLSSGEVLFSNHHMNEMMGYDFLGEDSRKLIVDLHDRFDSIDSMRKPFISKERVVNWRSYLQPLGEIMDITEIRMEWLHGEPASMIILRKSKDL